MSMTLSETDKIYKRAFHHRNDSGDDDELDVFEAARYFSGYNEASAAFSQKVLREDHHQHQHHRQQQHRQHQAWRGGRISLDMPIRDSSILQLPHHSSNSVDPKQLTKDKKYKQPSSPGGRLASFLNSLFSQSGSKKKKSSSSKSMKDEEESPGGRRKQRRSSISHFRSSSSTTTTTTTDSSSKSLYSSSSSGFRTPPPYAALHTPTKSSYKDFRSYSDHKHSNIGGQQVPLKPTSSTTIAALLQSNNEVTFNKFKFINNDNDAHPEKHKARNWVISEDQKEKIRKFDEEIDDGAESDSSSDLFELTNYDLGVYSSGLPVYETTHMDSIKRGAPISNGAL